MKTSILTAAICAGLLLTSNAAFALTGPPGGGIITNTSTTSTLYILKQDGTAALPAIPPGAHAPIPSAITGQPLLAGSSPAEARRAAATILDASKNYEFGTSGFVPTR